MVVKCRQPFFSAPAPEAGGTPSGVTHVTSLGGAHRQNGAGGPPEPQRHGAGAIIMRRHHVLMAEYAKHAAGALPLLLMGTAAAHGRGYGGNSGRLAFLATKH